MVVVQVLVNLIEGPRAGARWTLLPGDSVTFGRTDRADEAFPSDATLSSLHFEIELSEEGCSVRDCGSTNGTWMRDQRIANEIIEDGDQIRAGKLVFEIQLGSSRDDPVAAARVESRPKPPAVSSAAATHSPSMIAASKTGTDGDGRKVKKSSVNLAVKLEKSASQNWVATAGGASATTLAMIERLSPHLHTIFLIDFVRSGLSQEDFVSADAPGLLLDHLPAEASEVSPRLVQLDDFVEWSACADQGWGGEGIAVFFTDLEANGLLENLQKLIYGDKSKSSQGQTIQGLCWPNVLAATLQCGPPPMAQRIAELADAILIDTPETDGGWTLLGDDRLPDLLKQKKIEAIAS